MSYWYEKSGVNERSRFALKPKLGLQSFFTNKGYLQLFRAVKTYRINTELQEYRVKIV